MRHCHSSFGGARVGGSVGLGLMAVGNFAVSRWNWARIARHRRSRLLFSTHLCSCHSSHYRASMGGALRSGYHWCGGRRSGRVLIWHNQACVVATSSVLVGRGGVWHNQASVVATSSVLVGRCGVLMNRGGMLVHWRGVLVHRSFMQVHRSSVGVSRLNETGGVSSGVHSRCADWMRSRCADWMRSRGANWMRSRGANWVGSRGANWMRSRDANWVHIWSWRVWHACENGRTLVCLTRSVSVGLNKRMARDSVDGGVSCSKSNGA